MRCPLCDSNRIHKQCGMRPDNLNNMFFVVMPFSLSLLRVFSLLTIH